MVTNVHHKENSSSSLQTYVTEIQVALKQDSASVLRVLFFSASEKVAHRPNDHLKCFEIFPFTFDTHIFRCGVLIFSCFRNMCYVFVVSEYSPISM